MRTSPKHFNFNGADNWVDHSYSNGIVLIGDASRILPGSGTALILRDVKSLRDHFSPMEIGMRPSCLCYRTQSVLLGDTYMEDWLAEMYFAMGTEAEARQEKGLDVNCQGSLANA